METVQDPQVPAHNGPLNILLLGASGVGKSTFINAFCNYLTYTSLGEAVKGKPQCLIHYDFQCIYSNAFENLDDTTETIVVGEPGKFDETYRERQPGESCTQRCEAYTFPLGESREVRFIDTPGILDTKGVDADEDNIKHILAFLARYEVLHAVCILLRPNEVRLTNSLRYSIFHLLEKLHKHASRNILFCFTNSRSTHYTNGSTLPLLKDMLKDKVNIDLWSKSSNSMYFFDSEAFRYQVIRKQQGHLEDLVFEDCESSWEQSANEVVRLIGHISTLEPHHLKDTLALNRVRSLLESIQQPLGQLAANIQDNLQQIERIREEIEKGHDDGRTVTNKLIIAYQTTVTREQPQMVCTGEGIVCHDNCDCTEAASKNHDKLEEIIEQWKKFKVPRLPISSGLEDTVNRMKRFRKTARSTADNAVFCTKLSKFSGKCRVCKCPNSRHVRVHTKMVRTIRDEIIMEVLDDTASTMEEKATALKTLKRKKEAMEDEHKVVVEAGGLFARFLEQNSIVTYPSADPDYYKEEKTKMKREGNSEREEEFKKNLQLNKERSIFFNLCLENCTDAGDSIITEARVNEELQKLYKLELHGPQLKKWMDSIESAAVFEEKEAKARGEETFEAPVLSINNAAGVHDGARPKGLREKIAQEWHSRSHILK